MPPVEPETKPTVIMSELDSVIHERMKSQPQTLKEIEVKSVKNEAPGLHRMSLPSYFEEMSYDCTRGETCEHHRKDEKGNVLNRGKFILRWLYKEKRAIDYAMNVKGWFLVNRSYFPDAPRHLFSANGGVENGDALLAFMSVDKALPLRTFPSERSQELLKSRMSPSKKSPGKRVVMTGNPGDERFYEPEMSAEEASDESRPGEIQEGRDF